MKYETPNGFLVHGGLFLRDLSHLFSRMRKMTSVFSIMHSFLVCCVCEGGREYSAHKLLMNVPVSLSFTFSLSSLSGFPVHSKS